MLVCSIVLTIDINMWFQLLNISWSGTLHFSFKMRENMLQEEEAEEILSTVDGNADKKIDLKEFERIFMIPSES